MIHRTRLASNDAVSSMHIVAMHTTTPSSTWTPQHDSTHSDFAMAAAPQELRVDVATHTSHSQSHDYPNKLPLILTCRCPELLQMLSSSSSRPPLRPLDQTGHICMHHLHVNAASRCRS